MSLKKYPLSIGCGIASVDSMLFRHRHEVATEFGWRSWSHLRAKGTLEENLEAESEVSRQLAEKLRGFYV